MINDNPIKFILNYMPRAASATETTFVQVQCLADPVQKDQCRVSIFSCNFYTSTFHVPASFAIVIHGWTLSVVTAFVGADLEQWRRKEPTAAAIDKKTIKTDLRRETHNASALHVRPQGEDPSNGPAAKLLTQSTLSFTRGSFISRI